jgi:hypothetical protein
MQLPILSGIYSRKGPDFDRSYPINLVPYVNETQISKGYLRTAPGVTSNGSGQGEDRGGIEWNGVLYRVSGTKLIQVASDGTTIILGTVGGTTQCTFAISFDRLGIQSNGNLYYYDPTNGFVQVTDANLGRCVDVCWQDGYFIPTDGTVIRVSDLNDPTFFPALAYGSAEADPDGIRGILSIRGELYALGSETIEVFYNTGVVTDAAPFPFARMRGAQIDKGIVGTGAKCLFLDTFAFCGAGKNERPRVYVAGQGSALPISDTTVERALSSLTDDELATIVLESRTGEGVVELLVHLPCTTFVYSHSASQALQTPVWYRLGSGALGKDQYRPRNFVLCYERWNCGGCTGTALGDLDNTTAAQFGDVAGWGFDAELVYSEGKGAICHELELVGQFGRSTTTEIPLAFMSWTDDGLTFSQERTAKLGSRGQTTARPAWRRNGMFRNWRSYRFRGASAVPVSFHRLEAQFEALNGA